MYKLNRTLTVVLGCLSALVWFDLLVINRVLGWTMWSVVVSKYHDWYNGFPYLLTGVACIGWVLVTVCEKRGDGELRCRRCGHVLRGLSEPRCPECGEAI